MKEYNFKHTTIVCPECKNTNILIDDYHQETYCTQCGLIINDNTIFQISIILEQEEEKNRQVNRLWRKVHNVNIFKKIRRDSIK